MSETVALGEKLLSLLDESARTSTYKSALLLALVDRAQEYLGQDSISVCALAERVVELYCPQTLVYPTTGTVLWQNQAHRQASIVSAVRNFREQHAPTARALPESIKHQRAWLALIDSVEETLAEWPIPRLQRPYQPFLYTFHWSWQEQGGWSLRGYRTGSRSITLCPGVGEALTSLGPLLRPFITRWWTDKAAQLNPEVEAARSVLEFEDFLFGRDRVTLERVAQDLLGLQEGACFYCRAPLRAQQEIDHFIPWSYSGDDGLDNLVASCRRCNQGKRATLPGAQHLADLIERNRTRDADLTILASQRFWPRHHNRSTRIARAAYLRSPDQRPLWIRAVAGEQFEDLGRQRDQLVRLLALDVLPDL